MMPIYAYKCRQHGEFEIWQGINEEHTGKCSKCGEVGDRVFYPLPLHGDLPSKDPRPGKTRAELFDNLAKEDMMGKDWRRDDEDYHKKWTDLGVLKKPRVGWTPELG